MKNPGKSNKKGQKQNNLKPLLNQPAKVQKIIKPMVRGR